MAKGGIYDHLGGGFARYSTDAKWHIPHFEKMLYDNAQLAVNYVEAYQITHDDDLKRVAAETFAYIQRDMIHPEGGFYSAEDADSFPSTDAKEKKEGAFYVWERDEIIGIAGDKAGEIFCYRYGVREGGSTLRRIRIMNLRIRIFSSWRTHSPKRPNNLTCRNPTRRLSWNRPKANSWKRARVYLARIWTTKLSAGGMD